MAKEVYRIVTADGHEHDFHGGVERLQESHPGAVITGRRVISVVGEGTYEPYSLAQARAAERKESAPAAKAPAKSEKPVISGPAKPAAAESDEAKATP